MGGTTPDRDPRKPSSWLRTRLRTARGTALILAALCFGISFTAAALPRVVENHSNEALRDMLVSAPRQAEVVGGSVRVEAVGGLQRRLVGPEAVDFIGEAFAKAVRTLPTETGRPVSGVATTQSVPVAGEGLPRLEPDKAPEVTLLAQRNPADHGRIAEGRLPGPRITEQRGEQHLEAAVTARTAQRMNLEVGDTFRPHGVYATVVTVTGILEPQDAESLYWNAAGEALREPVVVAEKTRSPLDPEDRFWHFGALVHPAAAPALLVLDGDAEIYFRHPLVEGALSADRIPALQTGLASLENGPQAAELTRTTGTQVSIDDRLGSLLGRFVRERSAVAPLLAIATAGVATAAATVLLLWSMLTAERRRDELDLMRSRGGSVRALAGRLLAESAVPGIPAGAAGCALALLLTPGAQAAPAVAAAAAATTFGLLALPLRAAVVHRRPLAHVGRSTGAGGVRSRIRIVAEITVLVLTAGAVVALRQRGTGGGEGADPLTTAAPVLLSVAAAVLLLRVFPLPLRLLARGARRRSGPVAFLGLARASRAPSSVVTGLPLLSLLVSLLVASFGGMVLTGVDEGRARAARLAVGADARISSSVQLPGELRSEVAETRGVREVSGVRTLADARVAGGSQRAVLAVVEAGSYARIAAGMGMGAHPRGALRPDGAGGAVPALVSEEFAGRMGDAFTVKAANLELSVRPALVREVTPAVTQGAFVVISRAALAEARPEARRSSALRPNALLVTGTALDASRLRALTGKHDPEPVLRLRSEELASYSDSVMRSGAERLYAAAVVVAAALSALAVLLALVQTAPERRALLAGLRHLGMPRREGRRLILVEALPLYVLTAAAGVLLALASVPLLGPGIDLTALAGTPAGAPVPLEADALSLLLPAVCLLLLTVAVLLFQAHAAARRTAPRLEST